MEIIASEMQKANDYEIEKEEKEKLENKSYICLLLSRNWCRILALVVIFLIYCLAETLKEVLNRPALNASILSIFCKLYMTRNNISAIDVCEDVAQVKT